MTIKELKVYIQSMLEGFKKDPPDSQYQRGYHAALVELFELIK